MTRASAEPAWLQLSLEADEKGDFAVPRLEEALQAVGAMAVTLQDAGDDPQLEPAPGATPLWRHTRVSGLFDARVIRTAPLLQALRSHLQTDRLPSHRLEPLEDKDWIRAWMQDYHPMRFGRRLWICPSHRPLPEAADAVRVRLDPGLAFGTGTHPTTALCLRWLDAGPPSGQRMIDYGCGSGILAVAGALLGAETVWAVDIDPQALQATRDNARRNQMEQRIHTALPAALPEVQHDVLVANILAGPLMGLARRFAGLLRPGARLAMSGLLERHVEELRDTYRPWFDLRAEAAEDGWILLAGKRHDSRL